MDFLYSGLVQPMVQDGIDLQTIIVGRFGDTPPELCFEQPLGGIPFGACDFSPPEPVNSSDFRHYSVSVLSFDAWCRLLEGYDGSLADDFNQAPAGWGAWLREDAFKKILVVTDDRVNCTLNGETYFGDLPSEAEATAASFDSALLALSPAQFGTSSARKYMFIALNGVPLSNRPDGVWYPADPLTFNLCSAAQNGGISYQALSRLTGGFRFSICSFATNPQPFYDLLGPYPRFFRDRFE